MGNEKIVSKRLQTKVKKIPNSKKALAESFKHYLTYHLGRLEGYAPYYEDEALSLNYHLGKLEGCAPYYEYKALSLTLRDRVVANWQNTRMKQHEPGVKRAYYLSLEFLMGRALGNHLLNLDVKDKSKAAMEEFCLNLEELESIEPDAGLGNGGLGRLAACFMDSCASLDLPVLGYGLRYEYGMFRQMIVNGFQMEEPDHWLRDGNPWELERPEYRQRIKFGGRTEHYTDADGRARTRWVDTSDIIALPYDVPISGFKNETVNTLRLWKSSATDEFNLSEFNAGGYAESVSDKNNAENITMVLYPNDSSENGKELRLRQQYFLASASLQDVVRQWEAKEGVNYEKFVERNVFQMNDTHPTICVAELMRILLDEKGLEWDQAWNLVTRTMAYTNHTLLPEALEKWTVGLFQRLLPRLLEIIYEINARFMRQVQNKWPGDSRRHKNLSIIEEGDPQYVRMANLAIVGSFSVNGVAALHSELLKNGLFADFYALWPEKFNNKTNGVTPRRWIAHANPLMTKLISDKIGKDWVANLAEISKLKAYAKPQHKKFQQAFKAVKQQNKQRLADRVSELCQVEFNPDAMFDVQVKRIHEYKRQLLNVLHVIHLYDRIKKGDTKNWANRCVLIGGKAAPGYDMAKTIIKLINNVASVVNNDPDVGDKLKVAFYPNYSVSGMEIIAPAADLSEQISTAGKEASGTGNMKFMMNGALTIGTFDGANIEILEHVGKGNFFLFGLREEEVELLRHDYNPQSCIDQDENLQSVMNLIESGHFNSCEPGIFDNVINSLKNPHDPWMTLADFSSYVDAQQRVSTAWLDQEQWVRMSIMNTASSGFFSTDRTMLEYNDDIWKLSRLK